MTEAEWMTCADPIPMLRFLKGRATHRKLRLFLIASARLAWDRMPEGDLREAIEFAERYADGAATIENLGEWRGRFYRYIYPEATPEQRVWLNNAEKTPVFTLARMTTYSDEMLHSLPTNENWRDVVRAYHPLFPAFLRDVFGNPFRPVAFDPAWLTSTVVALAAQMYGSRDFGAMPILADALQDAGCDSEDVLNHCRGPGPHVRGCWVVDLVLGKV